MSSGTRRSRKISRKVTMKIRMGIRMNFPAQIAVMQAAHGDRQIEEDIEPRHGCQKLQGKHAQLSGLVEKVKGGIEAGVSQQDQSILRMGGI